MGTALRFGFVAAGLALSFAAMAAAGGCSDDPNTVPSPTPEAGAEGAVTVEGGDVSCPPQAPHVCEAPVDTATTEELLEAIRALAIVPETTTMTSAGAALKPSRDLRVTSQLDIDLVKLRMLVDGCPADAGADAEAEAGSPTRPGTCNDVRFAAEKSFYTSQSSFIGHRAATAYPAGVTCMTPASDGNCERISIASGTVVRFQRVVETFYFGNSRTHLVRVVRPCSQSCNADERYCAASTTCFVAGYDTCILCDGSQPLECACKEGCGVKPDGTECTAPTSDDTASRGTCQGGVCPR